LAKRPGVTVVGMAGSDGKVRYPVDELGLDAALNYRTAASLEDAIEQHCPQGIAAGPHLVTDEHAPSWWVQADGEGNKACVDTTMSRD
jgi:NADPH-dependent curcumin reductase CurA